MLVLFLEGYISNWADIQINTCHDNWSIKNWYKVTSSCRESYRLEIWFSKQDKTGSNLVNGGVGEQSQPATAPALTEDSGVVTGDPGRSVVTQRVMFGIWPAQFRDNIKKQEPGNYSSLDSVPG